MKTFDPVMMVFRGTVLLMALLAKEAIDFKVTLVTAVIYFCAREWWLSRRLELAEEKTRRASVGRGTY